MIAVLKDALKFYACIFGIFGAVLGFGAVLALWVYFFTKGAIPL